MAKHDSESDSDSDSDWNEELLNAVRKKQGKSEVINEEDRIKRVRECLEEGADVDAVDKHKNTALHLAVKKGYVKVIRFLVKQRAKIDILNKNGQTAVNLAEDPGKEDILKALKTPADQGTQRASTSRDNLPLGKQILKRKNTAENEEEDQNGKRQRLGTAEIDIEEEDMEDISFGEDSDLDDEEISRKQTSSFDGNTKHAASGLKQTLHGNIYQLKLLMLFLRRGMREGYAFRLATEMDAAEKFDDLVFQYKDTTGNGTSFRFLQAKHKQDETKTIGPRDLMTEQDDEFSIQKYFISYRKIKKHSELSKSSFKDFILCTNIDFDFEALKTANISLVEVNQPDHFLDIKSSTKKAARYKFLVDQKSELHKILERTAEAHVLARALVEHAYESKDITLRSEIFNLYHTALAEEVIDVENKKFSADFVGGKNLTPRGENFRKIFYSEALKQKKLSERNTPEDVLWKEVTKNPLKMSSRFGQQFKLCTDPTLTPLKECSEELEKLIRDADRNKLVKVNKKIYRKNAKKGSNERIFAENLDKLAGHVLIFEDEKIKFRSQFFDDTIKPPGNLEDLRNFLKTQLGSNLYNDLGRYQFEINDFKTCEEDQLYSKTELPEDNVDYKEIAEFFDKLIFAVNQPNEIELGDVIAKEIAADSQFNLLNADLVGDSFQKEMLDWFKEKGKEKGKEGRFFSAEDGRAFFDSAERKVNTLVSSGLGLSYPEELEQYGIEIEDEDEELRDFLIPDSCHGARQALNLIAAGETLPSVIRVHQAIRRTERYREQDSLMFLRLRTLRLQGIRKRVFRAFASPHSHHLLIIDCESVGKQAIQGLYNRLCETMRRNVGKKLILVTRENRLSANRPKIRFKNCYEIHDDVRFNDLTGESRRKLLAKLVIRFQEQREKTSFERLLGTCCSNDVMQELIDFGGFIDTSTLVKLIRGEEIKVGNDLKGLGEIKNYYINRTINRQVIIKGDILRSPSKSDLFAVSGNRGALTNLMPDGAKIRSFDEIDSEERRPNELIILDNDREDEQFETLCKTPFVNVHWFRTEWVKLIWKKSRGDIATLVAHRDVRECRSCGEYESAETAGRFVNEDRLGDYDEGKRVVIISDDAGMGKTTMFTYLARNMKEKRPDLWVIRIDLNDFTDVLDMELKRKSFDGDDADGAAEFFVEKVSSLKTDLEKHLLKTMIKNRGGVALLFDGFDEISPGYKDTVIDLLQGFKKIGVAKLFVATRPHMREALETKLGIFSYTMEPFSEPNQIEFLVRFWKTGLGLDGIEQRIKERLQRYAKALTNKMVKSIDDGMKEFAGIPLQTRMLAEVFQDDREGKFGKGEGLQMCEEFLSSINEEPNLPGRMRIVDLYKRFVDKKYYIYCKEKKKVALTNLGVKNDSEDLVEIFLKRHQKLAMYTLFSTEGFLNFLGPPVLPMLLDNKEIEGINEYMNKIIEGNERTGIITQVVNGKPQFIHRTFVEYFSAIFLIDTLKQADHNEKVREFMVQQILLDSKYKIVRAFLNGLLPDESSLISVQYLGNASVTESWKVALHEPRSMFDDTVFHIAAREGNYEIVKFLLNRFDKHSETRKNLITAKDASGETISHVAANQQHWDELIWLVEEEDVEVNSLTNRRRTVLHAAAFSGNLPMVKWLVGKGALADALSNDGKTPLYEAVRSGNLALLEWLLEKTGDHVNCRNGYGRTVLHEAATIGQLDVVKWLVTVKNANTNAKINDGKTVLHEAADKGQWDVVKWLIAEGKADVNAKGNGDHTILQIAASTGDLDLVKWLVGKGADVNGKSLDGSTILHVAASDKRWAIFNWLVEQGADVNAKSWLGTTVLHRAASQQKWDIVKWLVAEKGADVNIADVNDVRVIHMAARRKRWDLVEWLLENSNADVNAVAHSEGTVLCHAALQDRWDTVKWLVEEKNADANLGSISGKCVMHFAALANKWDLVNWLVLDRGADVNVRADDGRTLVHHAASLGQFDMIKSLLDERGADITHKTRDGMTVLHCAAVSGVIPLVKWLVEEKGMDIGVRSCKGDTVLHMVASRAQWDMVRWLVEIKGANVQVDNNDGYTVLHIAARFRQWDLVRLLASSEDVDVNTETKNGQTVLRYAVEAAAFDTIKWLIETKGVDVNAKFRSGKTILHHAVASGHFPVVEWLVDNRGADVNTSDMNGKTLLHEAAAGGKCEIFKWLVDERAVDINARDNDDRTLLHEAVAANDLDMIQMLVKSYKVDVSATDKRWETPLELYCKNNRRRDDAIIKLLQQGDCKLPLTLRRARLARPPWRTRPPWNNRRESDERSEMMRKRPRR